MAESRPESAIPGSPRMEADLRSATEAMQKAADAMVAATESFRRQLHQRDTHDKSHAAESPKSGPGGDAHDDLALQLPRLSASLRQLLTTAETAPLSRPESASSSSLDASSLVTKMPAQPYSTELLPSHSQPATHQDDTAALPTTKRPATAGGESSSNPAAVLASREWPGTSASTPTLVSAQAPAPVVRTGPGHSRQTSVDLVEAAQNFKAGRQYAHRQGQQQPEALQPKGAEEGHSKPLGSYTYIRSDSDTSRTLGKGQPSSEKQLPKSSARPHGYSLTHEVFFVLVISLAQMLMLAGISQALVPARIIGQSFPDTNVGTLAWYSAAYGLTAGTFVLPSGRLGDLFGHKKVFIVGFLWFGAWSLAAGFAEMVQQAGGQGTVYFCFCRAMQGIGPALLVPNGQAMLGRAYKPGPRKNIVMCLFGAAAPFGFVAGGAVASLFAIRASWPWAFWTLAAMCCSLAAVSAVALPAAEQTKLRTDVSLWLQLDVPGIFFGVSGLVLVNFAFNQAPTVSWTTPYTYFLLIIGIMLLGAFVYTELRSPHPLVPITAMRATTNFVLGCTAAGWGCFSIWVFYSFAFLEILRGWSPLLASAGNAHGPISGLVASLLTGYLIGRIRPHWIMLVSEVAFFSGSLLFATAPVDQSFFLNSFFSILVMPFGMDMSNPAATILLSNSVSREHQGIAASLVVTVVNYSISIALGIAGSIERHASSSGQDVLAGIRAAQYFGLGLGGLGIVLAAAFLLQSQRRSPTAAEGGKP